ncbi:hypothetical protein BD289DRAFT_336194, partial [Coniella lustricola]
MPTYLCHGFRWRRRSIRVYVVIQDLDDAAPEWITTPGSARCFIESFYSLFDFLPDCTLPPTGASSAATLPSPTSHAHHAPPSPPSSQPLLSSLSQLSGAGFGPDSVAAQDWSPVKLLEEYDPSNLDEVSRPHAYVADYITRIDSSCDIFDEIQRYETRVKQDSNPAVTGPSAQDRLSNPEKNTTDHKARSGWLEKLRNQLQVDADVQWYIVVNGGEDRPW